MFKKIWGNVKKFVQSVIKIVDGVVTIIKIICDWDKSRGGAGVLS